MSHLTLCHQISPERWIDFVTQWTVSFTVDIVNCLFTKVGLFQWPSVWPPGVLTSALVLGGTECWPLTVCWPPDEAFVLQDVVEEMLFLRGRRVHCGRVSSSACPVHMGEVGRQPGEDPPRHEGGVAAGRGGERCVTMCGTQSTTCQLLSGMVLCIVLTKCSLMTNVSSRWYVFYYYVYICFIIRDNVTYDGYLVLDYL